MNMRYECTGNCGGCFMAFCWLHIQPTGISLSNYGYPFDSSQFIWFVRPLTFWKIMQQTAH